MDTRSVIKVDIDNIYEFWKGSYKVSDRDTVERIKNFITKNPDISTLAEDNGKIVGTTLGSYDGRKGYIYEEPTALRSGFLHTRTSSVLKNTHVLTNGVFEVIKL